MHESPDATSSSIAVIGGGFSGTMTAVHLARLARRPLTVMLIEQSGVFAAGAAYGTHSREHLLNVPAGNMSALPDEPDHFMNWLSAHGHAATGGAFMPRAVYREYLQGILQATIDAPRPGITLLRVAAQAGAIQRRGRRFAVTMTDGAEVTADAVVLAPGNFAPADHPGIGLDVRSSWRYTPDPWRDGGRCLIGDDDSVLIIGTGLTMVDLALELQQRGHAGPIIALSRRGLLHQSHRAEGRQHPLRQMVSLDEVPRDALSLLRAVRCEIRKAEREGSSWHDVIAALRPATVAIWREMPAAERARFLRHARTLWDVHRHRLPPQAAERLESMRRSGALRVVAGNIESTELRDDAVAVHVRPRASERRLTIVAEHVVNCMGPNRDVSRSGNPLLADLHARGWTMPDANGLGLCAADDGTLLDAHGRPQPGLILVGPLRQGDLWESVAVPELRTYAREAAVTALAQAEA